MARIFEYFVVCSIGPEIWTLDGNKGYQGSAIMYSPSLLDHYPPDNHSLYPPPPPQLPTCVLPVGVQIYASGFNSKDPSSCPRSYPIVLTEGDGSKIYVSCIAFRDPVCEDIAEAYQIPANSFADKCICLVSRAPSFRILREALEEIFLLCFSTSGSSGVNYIDAPTPYMMGLHSGVDTFGLVMDGVVMVDVDHNIITTSEEIPSIPEPEYSTLRNEITKLLYPNVVGIDHMKDGYFSEQSTRGCNRPWGADHDMHHTS